MNVGAASAGSPKPFCRILDRQPAMATLGFAVEVSTTHPTNTETSMDLRMPRVTRRSWTADQITLLCALVDRGVSSARASVVLKRPRLAVQNKARELGKPFADFRKVRAMRLTKEAQARKIIEHAAQSSSRS